MMVETVMTVWGGYQNAEGARASVLREAHYRHYEELQRHLTIGTNGPVLRVQAIDDEWRHAQHRPDIGRERMTYVSPFHDGDHELVVRTWVSHAFALKCPVRGTVIDEDFRSFFKDTDRTVFAITYPQPMVFRPAIYSYYGDVGGRHMRCMIHYWQRDT